MAIIEPAMLLSMELSAFQNQIEKRTSTTKSITARSEYGVDIFDGSTPVLLSLILAKRVSPQTGRRKSLEPPYYINPSYSHGFRPRENVSGLRNILGKIFWETLFIQNSGFHGTASAECGFDLGFCGVFSGLRNVLTSTFSQPEEKRRER